jgi:hypothetical protein
VAVEVVKAVVVEKVVANGALEVNQEPKTQEAANLLHALAPMPKTISPIIVNLIDLPEAKVAGRVRKRIG